jgi:predicted DCC family thiol-disulfide oxidoreductase YuxK
MDSVALEVFFDGECPLCLREVKMLQRLDRRSRIAFIDIAAPWFDPSPLGLTHADMMARIRGRLPDGTVVDGVEVFRRIYEAVGFKAVVNLTRLPGVSVALDAAYSLFAKNRLRLTGRCTPERCELPARG